MSQGPTASRLPIDETPSALRLVSYAQNFEDVMLWRALADVADGTYIDVGAAWPITDSVTMLFYERGWSGLNVEPNPALYQQLCADRERDINVCVAAGSEPGSSVLNVVVDTGLSTLDSTLAETYQGTGQLVRAVETTVTTLTDLWETHLASRDDVHFLKIDVEGFELAVIQGNDWVRHRPWVVLVEATQPSSQMSAHAEWEPLLTAAGYRFVYADGLNRFYVASEHAELVTRFEFPPNVFDGFVSAAQAQAEAAAHNADNDLRHAQWEADAAAQKAGEDLRHAQWDADDLRAQLVAQREWARLEIQATRLGLVSARIAEDDAIAAHRDVAAALALSQQREHELSIELSMAMDATDAHRWQVEAMTNSTSWKATRPLRFATGFAKSPIRCVRIGIRQSVGAVLRPLINVLLDVLTPTIRDHPRVRRPVNVVLARMPSIRRRLLVTTQRRGLVDESLQQLGDCTAMPPEQALSAPARQYLDLFRTTGQSESEESRR